MKDETMHQEPRHPGDHSHGAPSSSIPAMPPSPPAQLGPDTSKPAPLPFGMTPYPPTVQLPPSRRNYVLFAGAGLVLGLGAGLLLAQIDLSTESTALADAIDRCGLANQSGIALGDEGQSLTMSGQGDETLDYGAEFSDIHCVLAAIDMPDSVGSRLGNTRALDGTQTAEWGEFSTFWNYHPDDGMNVIVEVVDEE